MGFGDMVDKAKEFAGEHKDKVSEGMDKVGDMAKEKFGHEEQIDQGMDKARDYLGGDNQ